MIIKNNKIYVSTLVLLALWGFAFPNRGFVFADVTVNILAVNATDKNRDKEIDFPLPRELAAEDILDTAGLKVEFDAGRGAYVVSGSVKLEPKETKTFKIRLRDIWRLDEAKIADIKTQIDTSLDRIKDTEFYADGQKKRERLLGRVDFIVKEEERLADNVEKRIDFYRVYSNEMEIIRSQALSVNYWRSADAASQEEKFVRIIVEIENPSQEEKRIAKQKQYLPSEVKMEHLLNIEGFDAVFDDSRQQIYLAKEEELAPAEKKRYEVTIKDVWYIPAGDIENLRERTRKVFQLLEPTEYADTARYLVKNIKENLEKIDISQALEKGIQDHIAAYKANTKRFKSAQDDVEALEDLLMQLRDNLERSRMKNVLQKIKQLKSVAEIAEAIIGVKPTKQNIWRIIFGVVSFVGLFTAIHFIIWGRRSKDIKIGEEQEVAQRKEEIVQKKEE